MDKSTLAGFIRRAVIVKPQVIPHLSEQARELLGIKAERLGYQPIRDDYWTSIYEAVEGYLTGNKPVTSFRNSASVAMSEAFTAAVYEAWYQVGAEPPLSDEVSAWLSERIGQERGFIVRLFDRLKSEWQGLDPSSEALARAEGFARTLDALYSEAKLRGMKNQVVTWILGETEEHCDTCLSLAGKKHKISYLIKNNYIPGKPGAGMDCNGYRCDCKIVDKNGNEVTISE